MKIKLVWRKMLSETYVYEEYDDVFTGTSEKVFDDLVDRNWSLIKMAIKKEKFLWNEFYNPFLKITLLDDEGNVIKEWKIDWKLIRRKLR